MKRKASVLTIIFFAICVFCTLKVISIEYGKYQQRQHLRTLAHELLQSDLVKEAKEQKESTMISKYANLYKENNDLYGWLTIEDSEINYPVMQRIDDQNFYLDKNWEKEYSINGMIFADEQVNEKSNNIILYGHNMKDGSMFGSLKKYKNQDFYETHKYIKFDTLYEEATYEIISVSKTIAYYTFDEAEKADYYFYFHINMNSDEEFNEYVSKAKQNAYYETNVTAEYGDELLTLSTCDSWTDDGRLLVIAKKVTE